MLIPFTFFSLGLRYSSTMRGQAFNIFITSSKLFSSKNDLLFSKRLVIYGNDLLFWEKIHFPVQSIPWVTEGINFIVRRTERVTKRSISATESINFSHKKSFRSFKRSIRLQKSSFSPSDRSFSLQKKSFP